MRAVPCVGCLLLLCPSTVLAQAPDPVQQAIAQGDLYAAKHKYELAQEAYRRADKASRHTSGEAYLKLAGIDRKLGDFSAALDDAKKAWKAANGDRVLAAKARLAHANLLVQTSSKPRDKKLGEAEDDVREALALDPSQSIAHFNLGYILLRQERDREGVAELNAYLESPGATETDRAEARRMITSPIRAREPFAPDFSFTSHERQEVSNATLRGQVVLLDFWGTWCPPCRESVPILQGLQKRYAGKGFRLVSVSSDDDEEVWRTFVEAQKMNWTEYIDLSGELLQTFKIDSFPTYIVLDKDGVIRFRESGLGPTTQSDLEDAINRALKRASDPNLARAGAAPREGESRPPAEEAAKAADSMDSAAAGDGAPFGIEAGVISGPTYRNEALSLSYEFPRGWILAKPEALHRLNARTEAAAKAAILQQHPELAGSVNIMSPKIVLYASRRGDGDGQRLAFPCLRIMAAPSRARSLELGAFGQLVDALAKSSGAKVTRPPAAYRVKGQEFLRADFEQSLGGQRILRTYVQTLSEDYLLTVESYALSSDDKRTVDESLDRLVFDD